MVWIWKPALFLLFFVLALPLLSHAQASQGETPTKLDQGKALLDSGKIDESIEVLSDAIGSDVKPLAFYYRGMAFSVKGMQGLAIKDYSEAIKLEPNQSVYYARRGISRLSVGDISDALIDLNKALELEPSSSSVLGFRARALMMSGRTNQALEDINRAIQISPANSGFYKLRGDILTSTGNYENAVLDYDKAIQISPGFAAAFNNKGIALSHINRVKEAVDDLNTAMELASSRINTAKSAGFPATPW